MGTDDHSEHRMNALRANGIAARDYIQVFEPHKIPDFDRESDLVAEIHYPSPLDISDVLDICQAIQLEPVTKRYNLWYSNCYFFAWTIITLLARKTAGWERAFSEPVWTETCEVLINNLLDLSLSPNRENVAFRFEQMAYSEKKPGQLSIVEAVHRKLFPLNVPLYNRSKVLLWTDEMGSILAEKVRHGIRGPVAEETFYCISPDSAVATTIETESESEEEGKRRMHLNYIIMY